MTALYNARDCTMVSTMVCLGIHIMRVMHKVLHYGHPRYTYGMPQGSIRATRTDTPHAHLIHRLSTACPRFTHRSPELSTACTIVIHRYPSVIHRPGPDIPRLAHRNRSSYPQAYPGPSKAGLWGPSGSGRGRET